MAKKKTITAQEEKPKQTHAEELELKGKVQQVKELWYKAIESDKDGVIPGKMLGSKYDTKNRLFNFNKHGGKTEEYTFGITGAYTKGTYNEKGVYQQSESYRIDGVLEWRAVSLYDERGNGSGTICYNAEGGVMWRNTITFNEMNKITGIYNYNPQDELSYWSENKYDDKGNQTESKIYSKDGEVTNWQTYKYNDKNDCIELNFYKPDGSLERSSSYSYEYDSDGKRINNYTPPEKKLHESYTYKYDKHGNWIEKIKRFKNVAELIVKRDITYYNDPSEKLELNINIPYNVDAEGEITAKNTEALESLTAQQAMWLAEGSPTPDAFSATRYFVVKNNEVPSSTVLTKQNVEVIALMHALTEEKGAKLVHTYKTAWGTYDEDILKYTLFFPESGYLLQATSIYKQSEDDYIVPDYVTDLIEHRDYLLHFSQLVLYHPSDASGKRDLEFESDLDSFLSLYMLEKVPDKPVIYMVQVAGNTFTLKSHPVNDNFEIKDLDVNYGYGFEKFHTDLMKRFMHKTKGLVLFHGEPGTGKTFYIRHLLRKMASLNKVVIYMPPNMVDHLVDPSFMTFISQQVGYYSSQGYFCALLIEDAEPLLAARQTEIRNQGVTNLLNMTDGLLNDMLNLQIICTFNVNVKELDKALLRPGRLIARKEFKALSELDANLLAQRLGIKHHFNGPATLSEIYAMLKDNSTITHDVDEIELDF